MNKKIKNILDFFEVHLMVILMVVFMANIFCQIFFRVVFKYPLFFAEELSRYAFLWMVFLGLSYATLHDKHIRVGLLVNRMPREVQIVIDVLIQALTIAAFFWILTTSIKYLSFCGDTVTSAMRIPKKFVALILPFSSVLVIIRSFQKIFDNMKELTGKKASCIL